MTDSTNIAYSVVVPVGSRVDELDELLAGYSEALRQASVTFEIIVVLDGMKPTLFEDMQRIVAENESVRVIQFSRRFGESAAIMAGFNESRGNIMITLPAYWQVNASEIGKMISSFTGDDDMLIAVRSPRAGSAFERIRRRAFHGILKFITGQDYRDLGCGVRLFKREIMDEIPLYGDQDRFLPVLAVRRGFRVREVELEQSPRDHFRGRYRLRDYLHGILNVFTVFFLVRFTKKPLRFFGSIGSLAAGFGGIVVMVLVIQRMFFDIPLGDRPALLLGSLLVVLGVQLFALGLLGELVIFSQAGRSKEYAIRSIVHAPSGDSPDSNANSSTAAGSDARTVGRRT